MHTLMKSSVFALVAAIICGNAAVRGSVHRKLAKNYLDGQTAADRLSWSYDDNDKGKEGVCTKDSKCGPAMWSKIKAVGTTVNECAGKQQTPININAAQVVVDSTLKYPTFTEIDGGCTSWSTFTDDHALEMNFGKVNFVCTNFRITHKGTEYALLQMHFHSPAEHTVGGGYADAEVHYVHKSAGGQYLVVGVMMTAATHIGGSGNTLMSLFWSKAAAFGNQDGMSTANDDGVANATSYQWGISTNTKMHAYDFLPGSKEYWTYPGSLTTYPCSEGITWVLMKESISISVSDLSKLRKTVKYYPKNIINPSGNDNRPVQPLGDRIVYSYEGFDPVEVEKSGGKELTRDYAAFSILILAPIIILLILWYFGCLACFCQNQGNDQKEQQTGLNEKQVAQGNRDQNRPDFIPIDVR